MSNTSNPTSPIVRSDQFIVLSLPRSRSAWMAHWLSYPGKRVGHDIGIQCDSFDQFVASYRNGMDGTVETGAMIGWRLLKHELPRLKTLVVIRDPHEVLLSLAAKGVAGPAVTEEISARYHMLQAIATVKGVRLIDWSELSDAAAAEMIWEWLLELPFDADWYSRFQGTNIQIDFAARLQQLQQRHAALAAMKADLLVRQQAIGMAGCPVFN